MKNDMPDPDNASLVVPDVTVENKIYIIRGRKVMLDSDLAFLYGVDTKRLNEAVKRNSARFPADFMFQLNTEEHEILRSQFATLRSSNLRSQFATSSYGGRRWDVYAFTELGIAMLSSVLRSNRAIQVNIQIMRAFTQMRHMLASNTELRDKIDELETKYDGHFKVVFEALRELMEKPSEPEEPREKIGFDLNKG